MDKRNSQPASWWSMNNGVVLPEKSPWIKGHHRDANGNIICDRDGPSTLAMRGAPKQDGAYYHFLYIEKSDKYRKSMFAEYLDALCRLWVLYQGNLTNISSLHSLPDPDDIMAEVYRNASSDEIKGEYVLCKLLGRGFGGNLFNTLLDGLRDDIPVHHTRIEHNIDQSVSMLFYTQSMIMPEIAQNISRMFETTVRLDRAHYVNVKESYIYDGGELKVRIINGTMYAE